jgi:hypothetical protein
MFKQTSKQHVEVNQYFIVSKISNMTNYFLKLKKLQIIRLEFNCLYQKQLFCEIVYAEE